MISWVRGVLPLPTASDLGEAADTRLCKLLMPTLFVCGTNDIYLLCSSPAASKTKDFVADGKYTYFGAPYGHNLFQNSPGGDLSGCTDQAAVDSVSKAITDRIMKRNP